MSRITYPQVVLFGSMTAGWREEIMIPLLEQLGVTYYHPSPRGGDWHEDKGKSEALVMQHAETIVIVIDANSSSFASLTETGWAAASSAVRGQRVILYIAPDYRPHIPLWMRFFPPLRRVFRTIEDASRRARFLVLQHAERLRGDIPGLIICDSVENVRQELINIYGTPPA